MRTTVSGQASPQTFGERSKALSPRMYNIDTNTMYNCKICVPMGAALVGVLVKLARNWEWDRRDRPPTSMQSD